MSNIFLKLGNFQASLQASRAVAPILSLGLLASLGTITPLMAQVSFGRFAASARQAEAKNTINAMEQAEKAFYTQKGKFTSNISQLGVQSKGQNYRYQSILPKGKGIPRVMMTAQAKRIDIRSYTSAVFVLTSNHQHLLVSGICETDAPSVKPPAMPTPPKNASGQVQCPRGSHLI